MVGASGTGIQEFTSLVHQAGSGISHAIGTGSHDLSNAVGGITTLMGIDALEADLETRVIAIVSKPAENETLENLIARIQVCKKPVVGCFLGLTDRLQGAGEHFHQAATIDEAVRFALQNGLVENRLQETAQPVRQEMLQQEVAQEVAQEVSSWQKEQRYLRGLFAGGTFCYQTQQVLREAGFAVYSNAPLDKRYKLENPEMSLEHSVIDLGEDYFTQGKPHPMIDATERRKRIMAEAEDPEVAILLLDFILGDIASADPVGDLNQAIRDARSVVDRPGGCLTVVASVCGTDQDAQGLEHQRKVLEGAGVWVFPSNFQAAKACARLLMASSGGANGK